MKRQRLAGLFAALMAAVASVGGQSAPQTPQSPASAASSPVLRMTMPTRDPRTPGYVTATELPDGTVAGPGVNGNFIIGPTHTPAPEVTVHDGVPQGTVHTFTMNSAHSRIYPGRGITRSGIDACSRIRSRR